MIAVALAYTVINALLAVVYYGIIFTCVGWLALRVDQRTGWGLSESWAEFKAKARERRAERRAQKEQNTPSEQPQPQQTHAHAGGPMS